jgi:hypothetical protein
LIYDQIDDLRVVFELYFFDLYSRFLYVNSNSFNGRPYSFKKNNNNNQIQGIQIRSSRENPRYSEPAQNSYKNKPFFEDIHSFIQMGSTSALGPDSQNVDHRMFLGKEEAKLMRADKADRVWTVETPRIQCQIRLHLDYI